MPRIDCARRRLALLCLLLVPLGAVQLAAQEADINGALASAAAVDPTQVQQRIDALAADSELPEAERDALTKQLQAVLDNLARARSFSERARDYAAALDDAPRETKATRQQLAAAADAQDAAPNLDVPEDASLDALDARMAAEQAEIAVLEARIGALDESLAEMDAAPARLRHRATELDAELAKSDLGDQHSGGAGAADDNLSFWLRQSQRALHLAERHLIQQQLLSAPARRDLARAQRDRAELDLAEAKARRDALQERVEARRREQAVSVQRAAEADREAVADADPLVRDVADQNAELAASISDTTTAMNQLDDARTDIEQRIARIDENFANARKRLESVGLNRALGQVLIDQRAQLPNPRRLHREADERSDEIAESTLLSIRWREELSRLNDLDTWLDNSILGRELGRAERDELLAGLRAQVETRRTLLRQAIGLQERYRGALEQLDFTARQLGDLSHRYDRYLQERLLWVRSIVPLVEQPFGALPSAMWWVVSPVNWSHVGTTLLHEASRSPRLWLGVLLVTVLLWRSAPIRRAIRATAEPLRRISTDSFQHTLRGISLTLVAAAPWPLLVITVGSVLSGSLAGDAFTKAVGDALVAISPALYFLLAFRMLCIRGGVGDRHFRWHTDTMSLVRNSAYSAIGLLLPLGIVAAMISSYQESDYTGTLGRLSLALFEFGLAVFTATVLHPTRGALKHAIAENPEGWLSRLRVIWYPAMIGVPLGLGLLALTGFLYTSGVLVRSLINELWLALGLIVAHQLISRWLLVSRRRLALQAALDRRAQREAAKQTEGSATELLAVPEEEVDLATLDVQTRKLLNLTIFVSAVVGLWLVWSDVLPALNLLERVTLWTYEGTVDGVSQLVPVTLADLGLVLVILAAAIAAARNLPALLEIILLQNNNVSAGSRYTIITLTGYAITAAGAMLIFSTLGLSWGQVQWLVAALGVGIGFGLQEIVANFVSGLIILFERPVRVGDVVTIGDTSGAVTKIEIRATTIRNWDRQELLVPNKELITGRLINWTLTDTTNRITIPVGAEYGCDTRKAMELLAEAAGENEHVLDDPPPVISFEGFGNDALTLALRCYLADLDYRIDTITQLHQAIDDKFRAAGIGIAFPQRDVHLRASEPLEVHLTPARTSAPPEAVGEASASNLHQPQDQSISQPGG